MALCLFAALAGPACEDSRDDSIADARCDVLPVTPSFTVTGAELRDSGELIIKGQIDELSIVADVVDLTVSDGLEVVRITIENSGIDEIDLAPGEVVEVAYWYVQGFEGIAQAVRVRDPAGVVLLVEDGNYGNATSPADLEPFTVAQTDIGCRNRENRPGSLNNFALTISGAGDAAELMPGAHSVITVDDHDYAVRSLRSTSRHSDRQWDDAPYTYTSFSIARLPDDSAASSTTPETSGNE